MVTHCYNPTEMVGHNELGFECDGYLHLNAPEYPPKDAPEFDPNPAKY